MTGWVMLKSGSKTRRLWMAVTDASLSAEDDKGGNKEFWMADHIQSVTRAETAARTPRTTQYSVVVKIVPPVKGGAPSFRRSGSSAGARERQKGAVHRPLASSCSPRLTPPVAAPRRLRHPAPALAALAGPAEGRHARPAPLGQPEAAVRGEPAALGAPAVGRQPVPAVPGVEGHVGAPDGVHAFAAHLMGG